MKTQKKRLLSVYTALSLTVPISIGSIVPTTYASGLLDNEENTGDNSLIKNDSTETTLPEQSLELTATTSTLDENPTIDSPLEENLSPDTTNPMLEETLPHDSTTPTLEENQPNEVIPLNEELTTAQPFDLNLFDVTGIFEVTYNAEDTSLEDTLVQLCTSYQIVPEVIVNLQITGTGTLTQEDQAFLSKLPLLAYVDISTLQTAENTLYAGCLNQPNLSVVILPSTLEHIENNALKLGLTFENFPNNLKTVPKHQFNGATINADVVLNALDVDVEVSNTLFRNAIINGNVVIGTPNNIPSLFTTINGDLIIKSGYVNGIGETPEPLPTSNAKEVRTKVNNVYIENAQFLDSNTSYYFDHFNIAGSLVLPSNSTQVPAYFLSSCSIGSFIMPESVTRINSRAFDYFTTIDVFKLSNQLEWIGEGSVNCSVGNPTTVFATTHLPSTVTYVGKNAFIRSNISFSVDSTTTNTALDSCALSSFDNNIITGQIVEETNKSLSVVKDSLRYDKVNFVLKNQNVIMDVYYTDGVTSLQVAIQNALALDSYKGADILGIKVHSDRAFTSADYDVIGQANYIVLDLYDTVETTIQDNAFKGADKLKTFIFPKDTTTIGISVFEDCVSLSESNLGAGIFTIPSTVLSLKESAFKNTQSLRSVEFESNVNELPKMAFYNSGITRFVAPTNLTTIGDQCFYSAQLTSLDLTKSKLTHIGTETFAHNVSLVGDLALPNSLIAVGDYAFYNCEKLTGQLSPNGLQLGNFAFLNTQVTITTMPIATTLEVDYNDTHANLEEAITAEYGSADWKNSDNLGIVIETNGTSLTALDFKALQVFSDIDLSLASLQDDSIPASAFAHNVKLKHIVFPKSMVYIGNQAFLGCRNLESSLTFEQDKLDIGARAFYGCEKLAAISFKVGALYLGDESFLGCKQLTGNITKSQVSYLGVNAFFNTKVNIIMANVTDTLTIHYDATRGSLATMFKFALADSNYPTAITTLKVVCDSNEYLTTTDYRNLFEILKKNNTIKVLDLSEASVGGINAFDPFGTTASNIAIVDSLALDTIILPLKCSKIGNYALMSQNIGYNLTLNYLDIPENVVAIGASIFGDTQVATVNVPDTVVEIGNFGLASTKNYKYTNTTTINIGPEVTIGTYAFGGNTVIPRNGDITLNTATDIAMIATIKGDVTLISLMPNTVAIGTSTISTYPSTRGQLSREYVCRIDGKFIYKDMSPNAEAKLNLQGLTCKELITDKVVYNVKDVICDVKSNLNVGVLNPEDYLYADFLQNIDVTVMPGVINIGSMQSLVDCTLSLPNSIEQLGNPKDAWKTYGRCAFTGNIGDTIDWSHLVNLQRVDKYTIAFTTKYLTLPSDCKGYTIGYYGIRLNKILPKFGAETTELNNTNNVVDLGNVTKLEDFALSFPRFGQFKIKSVPNNLTYIGASGLSNAEFLDTSITGKLEKLDYLGGYAFNNSNISGIVELNNRLNISDKSYLFYATQIEEVILDTPMPYNESGDTYTSYNHWFALCRNLKKVTVKGSVQSIPAYTFYGCYALETVIIEEGVKSIETSAFSCEDLNKNKPLVIYLPTTLKYLGSSSIYHMQATVILAGDMYLDHPYNTSSSSVYCEKIEGGNIHLENNPNTQATVGFKYYSKDNYGVRNFDNVIISMTNVQFANSDNKNMQTQFAKPFKIIKTVKPPEVLTYNVDLTEDMTMQQGIDAAIPTPGGVDLSKLELIITSTRPLTTLDFQTLFKANIYQFDISQCQIENNTLTKDMFSLAYNPLQVQFPNTITKLEANALYAKTFNRSNLDISNIVYFGDECLYGTKLNLTGIAKPSYIGERAFTACFSANLDGSISLENLCDIDNVCIIPEGAFANSNLPILWTNVEKVILNDNSFTAYQLPLDFTNIIITGINGTNNLKSTYIISDLYLDVPSIPMNFCDSATLVNVISLAETTRIDSWAFQRTKKLKRVSGTFSTIDEYAFQESDLEGIATILGDINNTAFYRTPKLKTVKLAGQNQAIGSSAFENSSINDINLNTVSEINPYAFANCKSLTDIQSLEASTDITIKDFAFLNSGVTGELKLDLTKCLIDIAAFKGTTLKLINTSVTVQTTVNLIFDENNMLRFSTAEDAQAYKQNTFTDIKIVAEPSKIARVDLSTSDLLDKLDHDITLTIDMGTNGGEAQVYNLSNYVKNLHMIYPTVNNTNSVFTLAIKSNTAINVTTEGIVEKLILSGNFDGTNVYQTVKDTVKTIKLFGGVTANVTDEAPNLQQLEYDTTVKGSFHVKKANLTLINTEMKNLISYTDYSKIREKKDSIQHAFTLYFYKEPMWANSYLGFTRLDFTNMPVATQLTSTSKYAFIGAKITDASKILTTKLTNLGEYTFTCTDFLDDIVNIPPIYLTSSISASTVSTRLSNTATPFVDATFTTLNIDSTSDLDMVARSLFVGVQAKNINISSTGNIVLGSYLFSASQYTTEEEVRKLGNNTNITIRAGKAITSQDASVGPINSYNPMYYGGLGKTFFNVDTLDIQAGTTITLPSYFVDRTNQLKLTSLTNARITISQHAFFESKLKTFKIPTNANIGPSAFGECLLTGDLYIPKTTSIAPDAFTGCRFKGEFILDGTLDWSVTNRFDFEGNQFINKSLKLTPTQPQAYVYMTGFNQVEDLEILGAKTLYLYDNTSYSGYIPNISKFTLDEYLTFIKTQSYPKLKAFTTDALVIDSAISYRTYLGLCNDLETINLASGASLNGYLSYTKFDLAPNSPLYSHLNYDVFKIGGFPMPVAKNDTLVFKYGLGEITTDSLFTQYGRTLTEVYTPYTNDNLSSANYLSYKIYDKKGKLVTVPLKYLQEGVYTMELYWLGQKTNIDTLIIEPSNLCNVTIQSEGNGKILGTIQRLITEGGLLSVDFTTSKNSIPYSYELNGVVTKLKPEDKQLTVPIVKDSTLKITFIDGNIQPTTVNTLYGYNYLDFSREVNKPQLMQLTTEIAGSKTVYPGNDFIELTSKMVVNDTPITDLALVKPTDTVVIESEFLALNDAFRGNTVGTLSVAKFEEPQALNFFNLDQPLVLTSADLQKLNGLNITSRIPNEMTIEGINLLEVLSDNCQSKSAILDKIVDDMGNNVVDMKPDQTYTAIVRKKARFSPLTSEEQAQLPQIKILSESMALTDYTDVITYELIPVQTEEVTPTQKVHTITLITDDNGTATLEGRTPESEGTYLVADGESIVVMATPNKYYTIAGVTSNGIVVSTDEGTIKIPNVIEDLTIHVKFKQKTALVTVQGSVGGTVTPEGETLVTQGNTFTLQALHQPGYTLTDIKINGLSTPNVGEIFTTQPIEQDTIIEVIFSKNSHTVDITNSIGGEVSPKGTQTIPYGETLTITSTSNPGYILDKISINDTVIERPSATYTTEPITKDTNVRVEFAKTTNEVTVTPSEGGTVNPIGTQTVPYGETITINSTPNDGYKLVKIIVNGKEVDNPSKDYTTPPITESTNIEVIFSKNTNKVTITSTEGGTVSPIGDKQVIYGETVTVTATPEAGYKLDRITINNEIVVNPALTLTTDPILKPTQIHYVFTKLPTPTTPTTPSNTGTITIPKKERIKITFYIGKKNWYINDIVQDYIMDVVPEIKDQRSFVPIRFLSYALKVNPLYVRWDAKSRSANIKDGNNVMTLYVGQDMAYLNNKPHLMDTAAYLKRGRTMLPISQILDVYKHRNPEVKWDSVNQKVDIWLDIIADLNPENPDFDWYLDYTSHFTK